MQPNGVLSRLSMKCTIWKMFHMKQFTKIKQRLRDDWRTLSRRWAFYAGVGGAALSSFLIAFPDAALYAWNMLPADLKSTIPERYTPLIGMSVFGLSLLGRLIKRPKGDSPNV